jgi:hypothetical protein
MNHAMTRSQNIQSHNSNYRLSKYPHTSDADVEELGKFDDIAYFLIIAHLIGSEPPMKFFTTSKKHGATSLFKKLSETSERPTKAKPRKTIHCMGISAGSPKSTWTPTDSPAMT